MVRCQKRSIWVRPWKFNLSSLLKTRTTGSAEVHIFLSPQTGSRERSGINTCVTQGANQFPVTTSTPIPKAGSSVATEALRTIARWPKKSRVLIITSAPTRLVCISRKLENRPDTSARLLEPLGSAQDTEHTSSHLKLKCFLFRLFLIIRQSIRDL